MAARAHRSRPRSQPRGRRTTVGQRHLHGYGLLGLPSPTTLALAGLGIAGAIWYFRNRVVAVLPATPDYQTAKEILSSPDASTAAKQVAAQVVASASQKIVDAIAPIQAVPVVSTPMTMTPIAQPVILSRAEKAAAAGF